MKQRKATRKRNKAMQNNYCSLTRRKHNIRDINGWRHIYIYIYMYRNQESNTRGRHLKQLITHTSKSLKEKKKKNCLTKTKCFLKVTINHYRSLIQDIYLHIVINKKFGRKSKKEYLSNILSWTNCPSKLIIKR